MKKLFYIIIYLIIIFIIIIIFSELFVRYFTKLPDTFKTYNKKIYIHFVPEKKGIFYNVNKEKVPIEINKEGFRDIEWKKDIKKYKIFFIGDSFVAGLQVPLKDTFVKLTKKFSKFSKNIITYNAGMPGTGTGQQLIYYTNIIRFYKPELIFLVKDYNDLYDSNYELTWKNYTPRWKLSSNNRLIFYKPKENPLLYISGHLKLVSFIFYIYRSFKLENRYKGRIANLEFKQKFSGPIIFDGFFEKNPPSVIKRAYKLERLLLNKFFMEAKKDKVKVILVYLPADYQIEKYLTIKNQEKYDFFLPEKFYYKVARNNNIYFIDMTKFFLQKYKVENNWKWLHYLKDQHYNKEGHIFVANILAKKLDNYLYKRRELISYDK